MAVGSDTVVVGALPRALCLVRSDRAFAVLTSLDVLDVVSVLAWLDVTVNRRVAVGRRVDVSDVLLLLSRDGLGSGLRAAGLRSRGGQRGEWSALSSLDA